MEQIDSQTYFFYGGIIDRKPIGNCYFVYMKNPLKFVEKRLYNPRSYASAAKHQDFIYVFGGSNIYLEDNNGLLKDCSKYSILNDYWMTIAMLDKPTYRNSCSCIFNKIYIVANDFQYALEYDTNKNTYKPTISNGDYIMLLLADRWIIKRDCPELVEITENGVNTYFMKNYWDSSKWKNLEFQSTVFKRGNYIYLVEHIMDRPPRIFRLDTFEKQLHCITKN
ncbi:hypothetical protein SteCoe_172 [Stentor coeruleus]|uniref:Uncharacterized protein n=1 Tax=Stentor coeruleus TaxID=5963 RepID=A0A1R2D4M6_9CILI|nr:hypothetical protein SteCoe_172 [Stentor coeruleus]